MASEFPLLWRAWFSTKRAWLRRWPESYWRLHRRFLHQDDEIRLLPWLCDPDRTSLDIGAYLGGYANQLLRLSRGCVAFEPQPDLAQLLRDGYGPRLRVEQVALSNREGVARLRVPTRWRARSTIEPTNPLEARPDTVSEIEVPVRRLDSFDLGSVGFIKIDAEGHEQEVLAGAEQLLRNSRPFMLIEIEETHRTGATREVMGFLNGLDYREFSYRGAQWQPIDTPTIAGPNFIFLPRERVDDFQARASGALRQGSSRKSKIQAP